jgi:malate synthase
MYYQRAPLSNLTDLVEHPEGALTTEGMQECIKTVIRALVSHVESQGLITQGGKLHDRSSIRLSTLLIWHWTRSQVCFITDTGLEIHADVVKYLIRKEGEKMFARHNPELRERAKWAVERLTRIVLSPDIPPDLLEE